MRSVVKGRIRSCDDIGRCCNFEMTIPLCFLFFSFFHLILTLFFICQAVVFGVVVYIEDRRLSFSVSRNS